MDVYHYREDFSELLRNIGSDMTPLGSVPFARAVYESVSMIEDLKNESHSLTRKMIWVGNGGSAAIASHQATDFLKAGGVATYVPSDFSLVTCQSNDYGYDQVFVEPILRLAQRGDLLVAISSSGKSPNIINAVSAARQHGCSVITMSGFGPDNPLRSLGDVNFYVPSANYRCVESSHQFICDCLLETLLGNLE